MTDKKAYKEIFEIKPQKELFSGVLSRISMESARMQRRKQIISISSTFVSFAAIIPTVIFTINQFKQTGFSNYLSLLNTSEFFVYWKDILMILAESLPVYSILLLLSAVFVFLVSLFFVFKNRKQIYFYHYA